MSANANIPSYQSWLESFAAEHGGAAGTVHLQRGTDLELVAALNIPPPVLNAVRLVPHGKGMAGLAQVRKVPVQTCNLQEDDTGRIKPGARAVNARAGVALPVLDAAGQVRAVVGIAFMAEGELPAEREQALMAAAARLPLSDAA
ncbi:GAF domain-containing protein [Myxococcus sp. RHSTA-1-4]|uniref:GAF domain-containing protein n=1 Tax=Myxococcus sp. RHSTA-1-4 TaxID=2874601 RepID=UPI001CC0A2E7|nr:GAF domain-containing protein [Myxococcus sp. RHSTA-1-4]MBZ4416554.1 GAF domain-containing protein [Myxococcus sp. RHSTA-1-4]